VDLTAGMDDSRVRVRVTSRDLVEEIKACGGRSIINNTNGFRGAERGEDIFLVV